MKQKTLQDQYNLIKEGKGHKDVFLKEVKSKFPNYIRNAATYNEATTILKSKGVIAENIVDISPINNLGTTPKESYETAFENFLKEARKKKDTDPNADIKKTSQQVEDKLKNNFNSSDKKNPDNHIFGEIMKGYYCELKDPKNDDKTEQQLKDIVLKNLEKDPIYYTKNGMFGEKGVGVEMDVPGLGEPKELKGKYKSSGYGDLKENKVRKLIKTLVKEEIISENKKYQKTVKEIEQAAKLAEITTKMEALDTAIETKMSRLNSIEESEDMKELMDKNALKELKKEIKLLEKYQAKVTKMHEKMTKSTKGKEIIDEDPVTEAEGDVEDTAQIKQDLEDIQKTATAIAQTDLFEDENASIKSAIKAEYKVSDEDVETFIKMHSKDFTTKEEALDEFAEYATANPEIINRD